jgi:hypothetical protein
VVHPEVLLQLADGFFGGSAAPAVVQVEVDRAALVFGVGDERKVNVQVPLGSQV